MRLKGDDTPIRKTSVSCSGRGVPSLRIDNMKYIAHFSSGGSNKPKKDEIPFQLYDLANDLAEQNNLAASSPEMVDTMKRTLEQMISRGRSTPGPAQKNDVEVIRHNP